jgi:glycosyltransferase involved in cell wall biosynthesis
MNALVSIVITTFNKAQYLEQSVKSVLTQTYPEIECIIVDDGSTDNTAEVAQQLTQNDSRVQYFRKDNGGVSSARNFGIPLARGEWVQFLDADDWIPENKIKDQLAYIQDRSADDVVCYSDYERVYVDRQQTIVDRRPCIVGNLSKDQLIERLLICPDFLTDSPFPLLQQTLLMKRSLLQQLTFIESLKACEDREFVLNLLTRNIPFIYVPIIGAYYRKHAANLTDNAPLMKSSYVEYFNIIYQRYPSLAPLCQTSLLYLIRKIIEEKDTENFYRVKKLLQFPVSLHPQFTLTHPFFLEVVYRLRSLLPGLLFYDRYRGPRSKQLIATFAKILNSVKA